MQSKDLFIFDLDGTLVNAYRAIYASTLHILKAFDYPKQPFDDVLAKIGHGDENFVAEFVKPSEFDKALKMYRDHHKQAVIDHSKPLPYARWILYQLKRKGKQLAIGSNRPHLYTMLILKKLDMLKYFDYVSCADTAGALKPSPKLINVVLKELNVKKDNAVFVGDMPVDVEAANRAKVEAVFVSHGVGNLKDVKQYKNKTVVKELKQILRFA